MPQFARPEFSVGQSAVSSSIAVTTYPGGRMARFVEMSIKSTKEFEYQLFHALVRIGHLLAWKQLRSDECFVDYVEGFLETMIRKRRDASAGNGTRNAALKN